MKLTYVVVPAFNESGRIAKVLQAVRKITNNVIVVDDGSRDNTAIVAAKHTKWVVRHRTNLGKGAAIRTGCELAFKKLRAESVILMDGDGQHEASDLSKFYKELNNGHQLVFGVRDFYGKMPVARIAVNKFITQMTRWLYGQYVKDILCGFRALSKSAYEKLSLKSTNYEIELEMVAKVIKYKMEYVSVPITTIYHPTNRGMTGIDAIKVAWQMINWRLGL